MESTSALVAGSIEVALAAAGLVLLWRHVLSPAARAAAPAPRLGRWPLPASDFVVLVILLLVGTFSLAAAASFLGKQLHVRGDAATLLQGAAAQLGLLAGVAVFRFRIDRANPLGLSLDLSVLRAGAATFLMALPPLMIAAKSAEFILERCGLPTHRQDLVGLFARAEAGGLLALMIGLAVVLAPFTEELVFRAGLFRYARHRLPRPAALLLPAVFFASLHVNWSTLVGLPSLAPLVVLAVIFSLAYERTGSIGTSIVAHALFNLNTIVLILAGVID